MIKKFHSFIGEGKLEDDKMDPIDMRKNIPSYTSKIIKGKELSQEQIDCIDQAKEQFNIDVTNGWFIFGEETDREIDHGGYKYLIYVFPAEDPYFDCDIGQEEFFPPDVKLDYMGECEYGYNGSLERLKKSLIKTGFFRYVPLDDRDNFIDENDNEPELFEQFEDPASYGYPEKKEKKETDNSANSRSSNIIEELYYFYFTTLTTLRIGDVVIYKNEKHKYNNSEFIYNGIRKEDDKFILKHDDKTFYATKDRVFKKNILTDKEKMNKFKKVLYFMVENGDISKKEVDDFIDIKINDPWGEDWVKK